VLRPALSNDPATGTVRHQPDNDACTVHFIEHIEGRVYWEPLSKSEERHEQWLNRRLAKDRAALWLSLQEAKVQNYFADHAKNFADTQRWVDAHLAALAAAQKAEADRWLREARERLEKSDAVVTRSERRTLEKRGLVRGRRR
jgi:hypothetical protein